MLTRSRVVPATVAAAAAFVIALLVTLALLLVIPPAPILDSVQRLFWSVWNDKILLIILALILLVTVVCGCAWLLLQQQREPEGETATPSIEPEPSNEDELLTMARRIKTEADDFRDKTDTLVEMLANFRGQITSEFEPGGASMRPDMAVDASQGETTDPASPLIEMSAGILSALKIASSELYVVSEHAERIRAFLARSKEARTDEENARITELERSLNAERADTKELTEQVSRRTREVDELVKERMRLNVTLRELRQEKSDAEVDRTETKTLLKQVQDKLKQQSEAVASLQAQVGQLTLERDQAVEEKQDAETLREQARNLLEQYKQGLPAFLNGREDGAHSETFLEFVMEADGIAPAQVARLQMMLRVFAGANSRDENGYELLWSAHEIGKALYALMQALGHSDDWQFEEAGAWALALNKESRDRFRVFRCVVGSNFNSLEMTGGTPQTLVQLVRSWGVRNKRGDVELKAIVK